MLKKTVSYTDWNGNEKTKDLYFNITKAELADMSIRGSNTLLSDLEEITKSNDGNRIMDKFRDILMMSYGKRTEDGERFIKSPELFEAFTQTAAYDAFFFELVTNADYAAEFVKGLLPADLQEQAEKLAKARQGERPATSDHLPKRKDVGAPAQELLTVDEPAADPYLIQAGGDAEYAAYLKSRAAQD